MENSPFPAIHGKPLQLQLFVVPKREYCTFSPHSKQDFGNAQWNCADMFKCDPRATINSFPWYLLEDRKEKTGKGQTLCFFSFFPPSFSFSPCFSSSSALTVGAAEGKTLN